MSAAIASALLAALVSFTGLFVVHVLWFRLKRPVERPAILNRLLWLCLPVCGLLAAVFYTQIPAEFWPTLPETASLIAVALSLYAFTFFIALAFFAGVDHSVRVRLLVELSRRPQGGITQSELFEIYQPEAATRNRLKQLVTGGYLLQTDTRYELTPKGLVFARLAWAWKSFLRTGIGG